MFPHFRPMDTKTHYDNHLSRFYGWMAGDFSTLQKEQQQFFESHNILPVSSKRAIDLGCGHGLQSISLAMLGFSVTSVDFSKLLLDELQQRKGLLNISLWQSDLLQFLKQEHEPVELIVCMGDTITHLNTVKDVELMLSLSAKKLEHNGKMILSFRDLTIELREEHRFIPVRNDPERIHTCFLEYFPDHVKVYDILHKRKHEGWQQEISWYSKLRMNQEMMLQLLKKNNIDLQHAETIRGMIYLIGQKKNFV